MNVSTCSPTCLVVGVQLTVARPAVRANVTPARERPAWMEPAETSSKLRSSPAFTAKAVPSRGVGACQRRLSCGPRVVPAPAPTAATKAIRTARAQSARFPCLLTFSVCPKNSGATHGRPAEVSYALEVSR